jgi:hypothetical protein
MRISRPLVLIVLFFVIIPYPMLLALPEAQVVAYAREDGPIEYVGAIFYFLAALTMVAAFVHARSKSGKSANRSVYLLLLAVFFFVCFGEEISWGQRVIGWSTPESLKALNAQGETNLHNFWLFQAFDQTGAQKSQIALFLHPGRLIALFWLIYCIIIPLAHSRFDGVRRLLHYMRLPIPPLYVGLLFLGTYLTRKFLVNVFEPPRAIQLALGELQETLYAVIFFILALALLTRARASENPSLPSSTIATPELRQL